MKLQLVNMLISPTMLLLPLLQIDKNECQDDVRSFTTAFRIATLKSGEKQIHLYSCMELCMPIGEHTYFQVKTASLGLTM